MRILALAFFLVSAVAAQASEATQLIERSEANTRGRTFSAAIEMRVEHGGSARSLKMRLWSEGMGKALVKIAEPAKDRDTGNLRIELNLWQFLPNVDRIVKIPPSLMLQSWMGSDFTNDDLVRTSSLARDYTHELAGKEKLEGAEVARIVCTPKPSAPVTWGKVIAWVRTRDAVPLKHEYYSENGQLLKIMAGTEVKTFGTHSIPTVLEMKNAKKPDSRTVLRYSDVVFDSAIPERVFTQENLRTPVRR
ncbi:MAG: outer membrane lipoprotein-sorting protein [Oligoflexia bacterium]|nr:outer membrane lipoprotein-sorting protein [Oligoflexia bacterium]